MAKELNLGEVIERYAPTDEQTLRVIDELQGQDFMRARSYSRTDARNAFFRIASTDAVTIVSSHARLDESAVIMPLHTLARIVAQVVHYTQEPRTPFANLLRDLPAVDGEVAALRLDGEEAAHRLHRTG